MLIHLRDCTTYIRLQWCKMSLLQTNCPTCYRVLWYSRHLFTFARVNDIQQTVSWAACVRRKCFQLLNVKSKFCNRNVYTESLELSSHTMYWVTFSHELTSSLCKNFYLNQCRLHIRKVHINCCFGDWNGTEHVELSV